MTMQDIYDFMNGIDVSTSFSDPAHNSEYSFEEFVAAEKEAKRVKAEIASKKAGTFVLEESIPAVKHIDEETMEEVIIEEAIPAVYFEYTTNAKLIASIDSELDVSQMI